MSVENGPCVALAGDETLLFLRMECGGKVPKSISLEEMKTGLKEIMKRGEKENFSSECFGPKLAGYA
jgi:hypothetical protein